jgi:DNA-binding transcriptional ArsR family regulator
MQDQSKGSWAGDPEIVERSLVLELLRDDHDPWWSREELGREVYDVEIAAIDEALARLREGGVVETQGERVRATRCVVHLDGLGMVCI